MKKNTIKLNESQLRNIIKESIKNVLNEVSIDTAISAHQKAQDDLDYHDFNNYDDYAKRKRQADTFLNYAQEKGADYYPYGFIGWYVDDSDGVFDRSHVVYSKSIDNIPNEYDEGIYALTREGLEEYNEWCDDSSCGYDLCYGKMKGSADRIGGRERDIWEYLTKNERLTKRVE